MKLTIHSSTCKIDWQVKGDKWLSFYYLLLSSFLQDRIILSNVSNSNLIHNLIICLRKLGGQIKEYENRSTLFVQSIPFINQQRIILDIHYQRSIFFALLPTLLHFSNKVVFEHFPVQDIKSLSLLNHISTLDFQLDESKHQLICTGSFKHDFYSFKSTLPMNFIFGMVLYAITTNKPLTLQLKNTSPQSILTIQKICFRFGYDLTYQNSLFHIHRQQKPVLKWHTIEGDYLHHATLIALAALNGEGHFKNLYEDSTQEEQILIPVLQKMGGNLRYLLEDEMSSLYVVNNGLMEKGIRKQLKATTIDLSKAVSLRYLYLVLCSLASGKSTLLHFQSFSKKEQAKMLQFITILKKFGVNIEVQGDIICIIGKKQYAIPQDYIFIDDEGMLSSLILFAFLNQGCIQIETSSLFLTNLLPLMKDSTRDGALEIIK